ncbi:hypothetical protein [Streptomyces hirsutus]|uniref:hypothetical protein n=1 Tax=Streptomyces hirsutus TaxID=35620 RepID=UPI003328BA5B
MGGTVAPQDWLALVAPAVRHPLADLALPDELLPGDPAAWPADALRAKCAALQQEMSD